MVDFIANIKILKLIQMILLTIPIFGMIWRFQGSCTGNKRGFNIFIQFVFLISIVALSFGIDDAIGGGRIKYILPSLLIIGAILIFVSNKKLNKSSGIPAEYTGNLTQEEIMGALRDGYSFQEIHKGLNENIVDIIKSTSRTVLLVLGFVLCAIIVGVFAVVFMLIKN